MAKLGAWTWGYAVEQLLLSSVGIVVASLVTWAIVSRRARANADRLSDELGKRQLEVAQLQERTRSIPELAQSIQRLETERQDLQSRLTELREAVARSSAERTAVEAAKADIARDLAQSRAEHRLAAEALAESQSLNSALKAELANERRQTEEKIALLDNARNALSDHFHALANEILEKKGEKLGAQSQQTLGQLLEPLKAQISSFQKKAEEIQISDTAQQATLRAELAQMKELNLRMTEEAHALATALRGEAKIRGNWGEMVLESALERSGLREGKDYRREVNFQTEDGRRRPDVVIYLPQDRHLVIDAKVSLNAYTRYINADDEVTRAQALKEHCAAVGARIRELADKDYVQLPELNSPEVVFMFMPLESAFVEAMRGDDSLFEMAVQNNVLIATPTTLLTSLNIVRQLWRFEEQNASSAELANRAAKVYKKLNSFLQSMQKVGNALESAKGAYSTAMGQLYSGPGNLIKQASEFKRLGVSVQGSLPQSLVDKALLELEHLPPEDEVVDDGAKTTASVEDADED